MDLRALIEQRVAARRRTVMVGDDAVSTADAVDIATHIATIAAQQAHQHAGRQTRYQAACRLAGELARHAKRLRHEDVLRICTVAVQMVDEIYAQVVEGAGRD